MKTIAFAFSTIICLHALPASAADFHVSTEGSDTSGNGTIEQPWRTPEYGAKQLSRGDRLLIHAGTYVLSQNNLPAGQQGMDRGKGLVSPPDHLDGTATSPITIMSAGDGTVLLDAGANPDWPAVGSNYGDYVIIDGLSVRGAAVLMWTSYSTIRNCDLFGGIDTPFENGGDYFGCVLRVEGGTGCLVQNNRLHDNQLGHTRLNSPLLMEYDSTDLIIEKNDIFNSVGLGVRLKDDPESVTVRYNYIYDNYYSGIQGANQDEGHNVKIFQNVLRNNNMSGSSEYGAISGLVLLSGWDIYNNTFYSNGNADIRVLYDSILNMSSWNNIFSQPNHYYHAGYSSTGTTISTSFNYSNYNNFYGGGDWVDRSDVYSSLTSFRATGFDANSVAEDPQFVNAGGSSAEDYKRTSYPTNGRGGSHASVMGAYITGDEVIGYSATSEPVAISSPRNLRVVE